MHWSLGVPRREEADCEWQWQAREAAKGCRDTRGKRLMLVGALREGARPREEIQMCIATGGGRMPLA